MSNTVKVSTDTNCKKLFDATNSKDWGWDFGVWGFAYRHAYTWLISKNKHFLIEKNNSAMYDR